VSTYERDELRIIVPTVGQVVQMVFIEANASKTDIGQCSVQNSDNQIDPAFVDDVGLGGVGCVESVQDARWIKRIHHFYKKDGI
jgi:hypothetical protein